MLGERPFAADHANVAAFFQSFQENGFTFDPERGIPAEFRRLRRHLEFKFKKAHPKRKELEERYEKAMDKDFEYMFGKDFNDIVAWQRIFKRIGVNPLPNTVEEAKKAARRIHVNIVELMDTQGIPDGVVGTFGAEKKLAKYTQETELFYPRKLVGKGDILEFFLGRVRSLFVE